MDISTATVVAGMGEVRAAEKRGPGVVVHDSSAASTVNTLEKSMCWLLLKCTDEDKGHDEIQRTDLTYHATQVQADESLSATI